MSRVPPTYRRLFRRDVLDICGLIFIADIVTGVPTPIFPLYTTSLGASLGLLGVITAMLGLGRLVSSLPVGMLSDRLNRKSVLVGGMLMFAVAFIAYAASPSSTWLIAGRFLQAIAMVATFPVGVAYIGDVVEAKDRGAAIGLYTAAMGSGFTVGPLIGSRVGASAGYHAAYLVGAVIACAGAAFGAWRLANTRRAAGAPARSGLVDIQTLRRLAREPAMLMACIANVAMTLSMTGAIFTYFPVYAREVGISTVTIGSAFAWRSIASALGRIPMGPVSTRTPVRWTLTGVLVAEAAICVAIAHITSALGLTALLILEGVGFGVFLVSAQAGVAAASRGDNRGAAVGMFWMAGSVGELFGPLVLGVIAQSLSVIAAFNSVALSEGVGACTVAGLGALELYRLRRTPGKNPAQDRAIDVAAGDDAHHAAVASDPLQGGRH